MKSTKTNHVYPEEEPYREFIESLSDKQYQVLQVAKEIQVGLFDIAATNLYIKWAKARATSATNQGSGIA